MDSQLNSMLSCCWPGTKDQSSSLPIILNNTWWSFNPWLGKTPDGCVFVVLRRTVIPLEKRLLVSGLLPGGWYPWLWRGSALCVIDEKEWVINESEGRLRCGGHAAEEWDLFRFPLHARQCSYWSPQCNLGLCVFLPVSLRLTSFFFLPFLLLFVFFLYGASHTSLVMNIWREKISLLPLRGKLCKQHVCLMLFSRNANDVFVLLWLPVFNMDFLLQELALNNSG